MFVAETMEEAEKLAGEHIINYMRWVCHWRGLGNHMDPGEELLNGKIVPVLFVGHSEIRQWFLLS